MVQSQILFLHKILGTYHEPQYSSCLQTKQAFAKYISLNLAARYVYYICIAAFFALVSLTYTAFECSTGHKFSSLRVLTST